MSDKKNKNIEENLTDESSEKISPKKEAIREFNLEDAKAITVSSAEAISDNEDFDDWVIADDMDEILELDGVIPQETKAATISDEISDEIEEEERSPIFKELAEPKLPELPKENRARLQMQSPTKLYFYWSVKNNPFQTLNKVFKGNTGNYTLVTKLKNKTKGTEELFKVEPEGNWWFNVDADADYIAELGFYAPNRPFIRVMFSNEIRTPRKNPSKRRDYTPSFNVNAYQFAEVLDVAGYQRDAFEVAFAGDDEVSANRATNKTYSSLVGKDTKTFNDEESDELRFVLLALASGYSLEDIRNEINPGLYDSIKSEIERLSSEKVLAALKENFDIFTDEIFEEEIIGDAIVGASLVNFPKRIKKRSIPKTLSPKVTDKDLAKLRKFSPISSADFPISSSNSN
jgi:hypothetical protein